MTIVVN